MNIRERKGLALLQQTTIYISGFKVIVQGYQFIRTIFLYAICLSFSISKFYTMQKPKKKTCENIYNKESDTV